MVTSFLGPAYRLVSRLVSLEINPMKVFSTITKVTDTGVTRTRTYRRLASGRLVCDPSTGKREYFDTFEEMKYDEYRHLHVFHYTKQRFGRTSQLTLKLGQ